MIEPAKEEIRYTRDQPIWWYRGNEKPYKAFFVGYRKHFIVIDVIFPDGGTRRKLSRVESIQPREEEQP